MANIDDTKIPVGSAETPIVGRLHDVSIDHVVAGANEIFDDYFRKRQSRLNKTFRDDIDLNTLKIEAEQADRRYYDKLLQGELDQKQLEIGAVGTDNEPILESPNFLTSGAVARALGYFVSNPQYVCAIVDAADRFLWGIRRDDGRVEYGAGIPPQMEQLFYRMKEYVDRLFEANVLAVEFEDNGDIAAYYGEEGNIDDVYINDDGDIILQQNVIAA